MSKIPPIFFCFLLFSGALHSQSKSIDSLKHLLLYEKTDTGRVSLFDYLSFAYNRSHPDSALLYAQQGIDLANKIKFERGEGWCLLDKANVFYNTGNYSRALELYFQALSKFEKIQDKRNIWNTLGNISMIYWENGDLKRALTYAQQGLAIAQSLHDEPGIRYALIRIGNYYDELRQFDSSIFYSNKGYELAKKQKDTDWMSIATYNLGDIYSKTGGQDAKAMEYFKSSLTGFKAVQDSVSLCQTFIGIAEIFKKYENKDSCIYYAKLALRTARTGGFAKYIYSASNFLADYYKEINNLDSAFAYQSASIIAKDSLFSQERMNQIQNVSLDEAERRQKNEVARIEAQNKTKVYGLLIVLAASLVVGILQFRNNKQKQKTNILLQNQKLEIQQTLSHLKSTQAQLIQSEKMASLGEMTAGIAHEIQNPLNFINNFSEVNGELSDELFAAAKSGNLEEIQSLAKNIKTNQEKIKEHGQRADSIVKSMLLHSRISGGQKEQTDINALCDEYLRLAFHGMRAKEKSFNAELKTSFDPSMVKIQVIPQDLGRVLLNLYNNAFYALSAKALAMTDHSYSPMISVSTKRENGMVEIRIEDNGPGIPHKIKEKIFQPFFTTKPAGQGTGLGLSLAYDIITKEHGGTIRVESKEGEASTFIIQLPTHSI